MSELALNFTDYLLEQIAKCETKIKYYESERDGFQGQLDAPRVLGDDDGAAAQEAPCLDCWYGIWGDGGANRSDIPLDVFWCELEGGVAPKLDSDSACKKSEPYTPTTGARRWLPKAEKEQRFDGKQWISLSHAGSASES